MVIVSITSIQNFHWSYKATTDHFVNNLTENDCCVNNFQSNHFPNVHMNCSTPMYDMIKNMESIVFQEFTKPALLKHLAENNIAVIGSDEIFGMLQQILARSDQGAAGTGERALLCSLFTGGSHSSHYSARDNINVSSAHTNLCVTGFTQPEKLKVLIDLMASQNDGLLDR